MRNVILVVVAALLAFFMVASPVAYKRWRDRDFRNFHVVEDGVLYRSGQLPLPRLQQIVSTYGIRTVISLREDKKDSFDEFEEIWVNAKALKFVRIPYRQWHADETGKIPADESVQTFREIMANPENHPVLVHCFAGIHRTGMMCAVFRMDFQGWTNKEAMAEMRAMGYTILDEQGDVLGYLNAYRSPDISKKTPFLPVKYTRP